MVGGGNCDGCRLNVCDVGVCVCGKELVGECECGWCVMWDGLAGERGCVRWFVYCWWWYLWWVFVYRGALCVEL